MKRVTETGWGRELLKRLQIFLAVDIGIVTFCLLEERIDWLYNTQLPFFSTILIVMGTFLGYANLVKSRVAAGDKGGEPDQSYDHYGDRWGILKEEGEKGDDQFAPPLKEEEGKGAPGEGNQFCSSISQDSEGKNRKKEMADQGEMGEGKEPSTTPPFGKRVATALALSIKGGFNWLRILGYIFLILSFFFLHSRGIFEPIPFLFGVSVVPAVSLALLLFSRP